MQDLEKYPVPPVQGEVIDYVDAAEDSQSSEDLAQLIPAIFRRWYIILLCTILIGGGG